MTSWMSAAFCRAERAVLAYLSSNLLNEVGSLIQYFEVGLRVCDIVVKKFTFAISSLDEFL